MRPDSVVERLLSHVESKSARGALPRRTSQPLVLVQTSEDTEELVEISKLGRSQILARFWLISCCTLEQSCQGWCQSSIEHLHLHWSRRLQRQWCQSKSKNRPTKPAVSSSLWCQRMNDAPTFRLRSMTEQPLLLRMVTRSLQRPLAAKMNDTLLCSTLYRNWYACTALFPH